MPFTDSSRRLFLRGLAALPLLPWAARAEAAPAPVNYLLNRFSIAGFQYYAGPQWIEHIQLDDPLHLVREPDNPHDRFAVRIEWRGVKLGYIPRSDNWAISRLLRQGARLTGNVTYVAPRTPPWLMMPGVQAAVEMRG